MVEPTDLRPKKALDTEVAWVCQVCQCTTWYIHGDSVSCAHCEANSELPPGTWVRFISAPYEAPEKDLDGTRNVVDFTHSGAALKHLLREITTGGTACVIAVDNDGSVHTWNGGDIKTEEQIKWAMGRVARGLDTLFTEDLVRVKGK
jgi:hypothetical protein